mgnify:CR=1 FL=1
MHKMTLGPTMALILDGSSENFAHVWTTIDDLICVRHHFYAHAVVLTKIGSFISHIHNAFITYHLFVKT